jgi:nitroreductase
MEYAQVIRTRRMVREFTDEPVPLDCIEAILASALRAPSAGFSQGWAFFALTEPPDRGRFWSFAGTQLEHSPRMRNAPLVVVSLSHKDAYLDRYAESDKGWADRAESRWPAPYWDIDTGMATLLMLLTAVDLGLGACFFGLPPDELDGFRKAFGIPAAYLPIGATAVGHRAEEAAPQNERIAARRRSLDDVVHRGSWHPDARADAAGLAAR